MSRVSSVARTVPQGAWTAVCALVLIASLGFAVVLGAGLSAWTGGVGSRARPVSPVIAPPGSGLVVVPGTHAQVRHPVTTTGAPPRASVRQFVRPVAAAPAGRPTKVAPPVHTPAPIQQPGPTDGQTPPPVVSTTPILVRVDKHGLVEKVAHVLDDVASPGEKDADDDQADLVGELAKAVAKGQATVLSPAGATIQTDAAGPPAPGAGPSDGSTGTASDGALTVVVLTTGETPDAPAVVTLNCTPSTPAVVPVADSPAPAPVSTPAPAAQSAPVGQAHPAGSKDQTGRHRRDAAAHAKPHHHAKHAGGRHRH